MTTFDAFPDPQGKPTDLAIPLPVELPKHDCWLVVVAEGPKPDVPAWYTLQDEVAAVSNPIFLDRDGDARWSSPFRTAEHLLEEFHDEESLMEAAAKYDQAVRNQLAYLLGLQRIELPEEEEGR